MLDLNQPRMIAPPAELAVPRYTSYPTAPHFHAAIGAGTYGHWLANLDPSASLSLYVHVPYCDTLCWFCGCHTKITRRYEPVAEYLETLLSEIDLVAHHLGGRRKVQHIHWGGGSPTILSPDDILRLGNRLLERFDVVPGAEFAIEIDPRGLEADSVRAFAAIGVNRVSLGLQDLNPHVQAAINRVQPFEVTRQVVDWCRDVGIAGVNIDLMYGLPHQTVEDAEATARRALELSPSRFAFFGYAHVPWMKKHQEMIAESSLPGADIRIAQAEAGAAVIREAGYIEIGLDHFAHPEDSMTAALRAGNLQRNFQGYTTDTAAALLGLGASSIGAMPQGYVQNAPEIHAWREAIAGGQLAVRRGIELSADDRLRRHVIERLMCDLEVDLAAACRLFGVAANVFEDERAAIRDLLPLGVVHMNGDVVRVPQAARLWLRVIAAKFDTYLASGKGRHSQAA